MLTLHTAEFLDRRKDDTADVYRQMASHVGNILRLVRDAAQRRPMGIESAKQLVVEVVTVRDKNDGWIAQRLGKLKLAHEEQHRQRLAGALRVPNQTTLAAFYLRSFVFE